MRSSLLSRAAYAWLTMAIVAIVNGIFRGVYDPNMSDNAAHAISSLILIVAFILIIRSFLIKSRPMSDNEMMALGVGWTLATVVFEFGFGMGVVGRDLDFLMADYDLMAGRTWPLVLLTVLMAPTIINRSRSIRNLPLSV